MLTLTLVGATVLLFFELPTCLARIGFRCFSVSAVLFRQCADTHPWKPHRGGSRRRPGGGDLQPTQVISLLKQEIKANNFKRVFPFSSCVELPFHSYPCKAPLAKNRRRKQVYQVGSLNPPPLSFRTAPSYSSHSRRLQMDFVSPLCSLEPCSTQAGWQRTAVMKDFLSARRACEGPRLPALSLSGRYTDSARSA